MPLFGQAGGYTFRRAGIHRIQVELELTDRSMLRSNVVEVWIRADAPKDRAWQAGKALQHKRIAGLLFHKDDLVDRKGLDLLDRWIVQDQDRLARLNCYRQLFVVGSCVSARPCE
jgi:hypothetical protein